MNRLLFPHIQRKLRSSLRFCGCGKFPIALIFFGFALFFGTIHTEKLNGDRNGVITPSFSSFLLALLPHILMMEDKDSTLCKFQRRYK